MIPLRVQQLPETAGGEKRHGVENVPEQLAFRQQVSISLTHTHTHCLRQYYQRNPMTPPAGREPDRNSWKCIITQQVECRTGVTFFCWSSAINLLRYLKLVLENSKGALEMMG